MRQAIKLENIQAEGDASAQKNLQVMTTSHSHVLVQVSLAPSGETDYYI